MLTVIHIFHRLQVLSGGDSKAKKVNLRNALHPSIAKSIDIIKESFARLCLQDQDILGDSSSWNKVYKTIQIEGANDVPEIFFQVVPLN